jgi:hypothetical protein
LYWSLREKISKIIMTSITTPKLRITVVLVIAIGVVVYGPVAVEVVPGVSVL